MSRSLNHIKMSYIHINHLFYVIKHVYLQGFFHDYSDFWISGFFGFFSFCTLSVIRGKIPERSESRAGIKESDFSLHITMRPSLMDEMAYRWHKRSDIDGQSDIASVILPPLCQTHAPYHHPLLHLLCLSSILWIPSFSVFYFIISHNSLLSCRFWVTYVFFPTVSASHFSSGSSFLSLSLFAGTNLLKSRRDCWDHFSGSNDCCWSVWRASWKKVSFNWGNTTNTPPFISQILL